MPPPIMKPLSLLLFLSAVSAKLPHDLAAKIPPCAQQCVQSFVNVNYNDAQRDSLRDLCVHNGASGFTLGEGAMQCLEALAISGHCSGSDASRELNPPKVVDCVIDTVLGEISYGAYIICSAFKGAIRPTHGVITATLAIAPTGGEMTFPPIQTHSTSTSSSESTETNTEILSTDKSTATLTTPTFTPTTTSIPTSTPTSAPITTNKHHLPPSKIAGIVGGTLSGLALLIGLFFLARAAIKNRRKRHSDTWTRKHSHSDSSGSEMPGAPIYEQMSTMRGRAVYARESYRSSAIGLALPTPSRSSPGLAPPQPAIIASRPVSRLLPDRPDLPPIPTEQAGRAPPSPTIRPVPFEPPTLQVQSATPTTIHATPPPRPSTPPAIIASPPPARSPNRPGPPLQLRTPRHADFNISTTGARNDRMSVATEFEEDGQESAVGIKSPLTPAGEMFCLPSAGGLNSAYVADGHGNWRTREAHLASPSQRGKTIPQRPKMTETHTSSSEALPQENRQSTQSASSSQFHRATEALALSNRTMSSAMPPTPHLPHESVRLSRATMPSPLFNRSQASPRSVSQPTLQQVPIPRPNQNPRSVSANQRQPNTPSQQLLPSVAESPVRPALRQNQPNFAVQPPSHHHYNPDIPHSSDDRASLPSRNRHHPPPSHIQHNFPVNPRPRAGPGGNPHGRPYPDSRYPVMPQQQQQQQQQRPANQRPYQKLHPASLSIPRQRQHQPQEYQRQPQPRETPYPEEPRSLWEKRQGAKSSQISINSPAGSGDLRWQRRGQDSTTIDWVDQ